MSPLLMLVEDGPGDVELVRVALRRTGRGTRLLVARDGVEALERLRADDAQLPDLLLVDVNLPRMGGHELLAEVRSDPLLARLPLVLFSTSSLEEDVLEARRLGADDYVTKPDGGRALVQAVAELERVWLGPGGRAFSDRGPAAAGRAPGRP